MAGENASTKNLQENPLIALLMERGADTATRLRGFIGPSTRKDVVRLFPRLDNLSECAEISKTDIIHSIKAPRSTLGAVILWVKKDAKISVHRTNTSRTTAQAPQSMQEIRKGRLRMRTTWQDDRRSSDVCVSRCDICVSECDACMVLPE